ncbi:MAG: preprotein translocase subunit YajC [Acidimicrobiales bacterium]
MYSHLFSAIASINALMLAAAKTKKSSSSPSLLIFLVFILVIGYFLLVRPQRQRARRQQQAKQDIDVGDEIMLTSGIIGRVTGIEGDRARVEISDGVEIEVLRKAVAQRLSTGGGVDDADLRRDHDEDDNEAVDVGPDPGAGEHGYDHLADHHFDEDDDGDGNGDEPEDGDEPEHVRAAESPGATGKGDAGPARSRRSPGTGDRTGDRNSGSPAVGSASGGRAGGARKRQRRSSLPSVPKVPGRAAAPTDDAFTEDQSGNGGPLPEVPSGGLTDRRAQDGRSGRD